MEPESEIIRFIQTWLIVYASLTYCFFTGKLVSPGKLRLLFISPVVVLFLLLPLRLTSVHFSGIIGFFISWLATFKLLLFALDKGPLASDPSISLACFCAAASLPIKITPKQNTVEESAPPSLKPAMWYAGRAALMAVVVKLFAFRDQLHPTAVNFLKCFHFYLMVEFMFVVVRAAARAGLGMELEPQFNDPHRTTSLQEFWGRRWNLMVSDILRLTVYEPVMSRSSGLLGRTNAQRVAVMATFGVSAVMHELIDYYLNRLHPTGKITALFLLHGACVVAETTVRRRLNGKWRVPRILSASLTIWFVFSTAAWLFVPELHRGTVEARMFEEYAAVGEFIESVRNGSIFRSFHGSASIHYFFKQLVSFQLPILNIQ
uniref:Wax synthase domain-containing protein n=1 Tax=Kalanchoe fedtschenkoi TaxID=63787 RepID=A0A7N0UEV8_KALFE